MTEYLPVPSGGKTTGKAFRLDEVLACFSKPALLRDLIYLVGGCVIRGEGNDVDLVIRAEDFPPRLTEALMFRLFRAFADHFDIPYDETPQYLHMHISNTGPYTDHVLLYSLGIIPQQPTVRRMACKKRQCQILEKNEKRVVIADYASTPAIDKEGERFSEKALASIWKSFQETPKEYRNLMWDHTSIQIGHIIDKYEDHETHLDERGFYVVAELRNDIPIAKAIVRDLLNNPSEYGFSIKAGIPQPDKSIQERCIDDVCWHEIQDAYFIEVSLTRSPANPETLGITIVD